MQEMLIDGGPIANNPSMYTYIYSKYLEDHNDILMISIGTGSKPFKKVTDAT